MVFTKEFYENNKNYNKKENNPRWKGGKPLCLDCSKLLSDYVSKRCKSCCQKGIKAHNYKNGWSIKKYYCLDCNKLLKTPLAKRCLSCNLKYFHKIEIFPKGKNHHNWQGGINKNKYNKLFNKELKLSIRTRDNFTCQYCKIIENDYYKVYNRVLSIHHIDYNKENCKENNLITLCLPCNTKANNYRDYWYAYYSYIIAQKYKGNIMKKHICKDCGTEYALNTVHCPECGSHETE